MKAGVAAILVLAAACDAGASETQPPSSRRADAVPSLAPTDECSGPGVICDVQGEAAIFVQTVEHLNATLRGMTSRLRVARSLPELKAELELLGRLGHRLFEGDGAIIPAGPLKKRLDAASRTLEREGNRIAESHFFDSPVLFALLALNEQPCCACFRTEAADDYAQTLSLRVLDGDPPREAVRRARRARALRARELGRQYMHRRAEDYAGGHGEDRHSAVRLRRVLSGELDADDEEVDELMEDFVQRVYPDCAPFDVLTLTDLSGRRYEVQILNLGLVEEGQNPTHETLALMPVFFLVKE